jgi:hypothetical protein
MSAVTRPRGPLPARVYWTRRTLVVVVALALVFGLARLLGGSGSNGTDPSAQPVGADASSQVTTSAPTSSSAPTSPTVAATAPTVAGSPTDDASAKPGGKAGKAGKSASQTPLPVSSGPCRTDDIVATPTIKNTAYAGKPVVFAMNLTTKSTEACDFDVSAHTLVVKVTSGSDRIWSTQDCQGAVPKESVVVRKDTPATVDVAWSGQRSDSDCTRSTTWAEPGWYHAVSAAFGSAPVDEQFKLLTPVRPTVTATPKPKKSPSKSPSASNSPTKKSAR